MAALYSEPQIVGALNFDETKRVVADQLIARLLADEPACRQVTLDLMVSVASIDSFPDLVSLEDAPIRLAVARAAVAELRKWTQVYSGELAERESQEASWQATRDKATKLREFADDLENLKGAFLALIGERDPRKRGHEFERFLDALFALHDMTPRLAYQLDTEEIDGALSFDTDDYIVEARWRKHPTSRADADIFATKVRRKGKNALGIFVSVEGFTQDALTTYTEETPFLAVDGAHLMAVLEGRVRLDDLFRRMKRHANETGSCYFPIQQMLII